MLPTMERRPARSTYSSTSCVPSCTARRVSVTPALTTIRLSTAAVPSSEARAPGEQLVARRRRARLLELPHSDREEEPQRHERHHHGRPAVTHERKRDAHDGQQARHHAQVDERLGGEQGRDAQGDDAPPGLPRADGDLEAPQNQDSVRHDQHETADEPPHLGEYGKNEIRMALREKSQPALRRAADALAQELSGTNGDLRLNHIVRRSERIAERIEVYEEPVPLVRLQHEPAERHESNPDRHQSTQDAQAHADAKQHGSQHGQQDQRGSEVGLANHERERNPDEDEDPDEGSPGSLLGLPAPGQRPREGQDEDDLEELGWLESERPEVDPAPSPRDRAPEHEHGREQAKAEEVQGRRGPDEAPVVERHDPEERHHADAYPHELAPGEPGGAAPEPDARQAQDAKQDDRERGAQQRPVHVTQEPAVHPQHQPSPPI